MHKTKFKGKEIYLVGVLKTSNAAVISFFYNKEEDKIVMNRGAPQKCIPQGYDRGLLTTTGLNADNIKYASLSKEHWSFGDAAERQVAEAAAAAGMIAARYMMGKEETEDKTEDKTEKLDLPF